MPRAVAIVAAALLVSGAISAQGQFAMSETDRRLVREILAQLVAIPTTEGDGATPRAAQVLADRLLAAGFPRADVDVSGLG